MTKFPSGHSFLTPDSVCFQYTGELSKKGLPDYFSDSPRITNPYLTRWTLYVYCRVGIQMDLTSVTASIASKLLSRP